jgi:hypothetical protein
MQPCGDGAAVSAGLDTGPELKPEQALALQLLMLRFPDVPIWYGHATGHWWALIGDQGIEADTPEDLGRRIDGLHHCGHARGWNHAMRGHSETEGTRIKLLKPGLWPWPGVVGAIRCRTLITVLCSFSSTAVSSMSGS